MCKILEWLLGCVTYKKLMLVFGFIIDLIWILNFYYAWLENDRNDWSLWV